jgi:hypothetical protein
MKVITDVLRMRERVMLDQVKEALGAVKALPIQEKNRSGIELNRLKDLEEMVCNASDALDLMIHTELSKDLFRSNEQE